jgi:uncharacterized repeat protein (TIGR01451 family)
MASVTTAQATINSKTFTLLGVAPVQVQNLGPTAPVMIVVSDTLPAVGTAGFVLRPGTVTQYGPADSSSNVYAAALGTGSPIAFNPIVA